MAGLNLIGKTVSHYRIEARLGEGGMGVVYRARDLELNRAAAIKFLSSDVASEEMQRRFQQEALTASSLNHPHILTVYEAGTAEGLQYLITEFIDGCNLREWVEREQPSLRQILELAASVADALACAHEAGIIHRDIKPGNILVSRQGYAKLVDFGLAKLLEKKGSEAETRTLDIAATRAGVIVGTIPYMSPEQISGKPADARTDIFSLGVVLYEILAGERPFQGKSDSELIFSIVQGTPRALAEARPDAPYELRAIVEKALEKEPGDRYQYMREMAVDLRRAQRLRSSGDTRTMAIPEVRRSSRVFTAVAAAAIVTVLGVGAWLLYRSDVFWTNPLSHARFTRVTDFENATEADAAISSDGKFAAFLSDRDGIFDAWVTQLGTGQFANLTKGEYPDLLFDEVPSVGFLGDGSRVWLRISPPRPPAALAADDPDRLRQGVWVVPMMGGPLRPLVPKGIVAKVSPDGERLVYHTAEQGDPIYLADRNGNHPRRIFDGGLGGHNHYLVWSLDGRYIYFVRGYPVTEADIWRIPAAGGEPERITHHASFVRYPAPLDNHTLLYTATDEEGAGPWLYGLDVDRRITHRLSLGFEHYISVAAGAGSKDYPHRLVTTVGNPRGNLWTVPITNRIVDDAGASRYQVPTTRAVSPRFGPGYVLFLSSMGGADGIWKFEANNATELWKGTDGAVADPPAPSRDGSQICFAIRKQSRGWLQVMRADGTGVRPLAEKLNVTGSMSWSPDGRWIVTAGNEGQGGRIYKVPADGGAPVVLVNKLGFNPAWSPDGRVIVYSEVVQGAALPLKAVTPEGKPVPLPAVWVRTFGDRYHFTPDGKGLVVIQGTFRHMDFWLVDLDGGKMRQLTNLKPGVATRGFDISPDGKQILFDRIRDNSEVVLIDLPR